MHPVNNIFYDGVILDLDGVITSTVKQHIRAWKQSLDSFLQYYANSKGLQFSPLDSEKDYKLYIDGKPRYSGVKSFINSRSISLPYGKPGDAPGFNSICALGNLKNRIYLDLIAREGAEVYTDTLEMIKLWRSEKLKIAVVSASKNCRQILSIAGITDLFDLIFDGNDAEAYNLPGKPQPDIFLQACKMLEIPNNRAVIIEDSISGVQAGKNGNLSLVIGISRINSKSLLYQNGADLVLSSLADLYRPNLTSRNSKSLPSALNQIANIISGIKLHRSVIFFDYDGTLTPIVSRHDQAFLSDSMKRAVTDLSRMIPVAIISGRELTDVKNLVQIPGICYAGNHGFELECPDNKITMIANVKEYLPVLDRIQDYLQPLISSFPGLIIERKRFSIAVHYRLIKDGNQIRSLESTLSKIAGNFHQFKLTSGKKVFELRPSLEWDKGKAVQVITNEISGNDPQSFSVYIGDDLTDEDAFLAINDWGAAIVVTDTEKMTFAHYTLKNTEEVLMFIRQLNSGIK